MFSFPSKVRFSETGADEQLTLSSIINYFQDCSEFHSEAVGGGANNLKEYVWILSSWQIQIHALAKRSEAIEIGTIPYQLKGVTGDRNFFIKNQNGDIIVNANSIWTYIERKTGRPARITQDQYEIYTLETPYPMEYAPRKIALTDIADDQWIFCDSINVHPSQLDMFGHMNNGQYVTIACDYLPKDYTFNQLRVEYKKSALLNDTIIIKQCLKKDCLFYLLENENKEVYTVLEYSTVNI